MSNRLANVNHAAGIFADMSVDGPAIGTLVAIIDRAKNLPNRKTMGKQNPYCAARLGKEAKKTRTDLRGGQTPRWDYELRFTVHESPDYFKLKVSVFNDDKRTDLIGETWVDLQNLIIPGGSQNDHWHSLQCRGKYAGDIRIEMTYYDTRQQDEAVIERRKEAAERVQGKPTSSSGPSGLSGPRQLKEVKRRPLPSDPPGVTPARPAAPEHAQSAPPLHHPMPSRPAMPDHTHSMPPAGGPEMPYPPRHSEPSYDAPPYTEPSPNMHPAPGAYDIPDHYQREWDLSAPAPPSTGMIRRNMQEPPYPCNDVPENPYDSRPYQPRSHSDYDHPQPRDHRSQRDLHERMLYEPGSHPQDVYAPVEQPRFNSEPLSYGPGASYSSVSGHPYDLPASDYRPNSSSGPAEDPRFHPHEVRALQPLNRHDDYHPEYATMQPRVEDEDEDGLPPPPPLHRSRMPQPPAPQPPAPSYASYGPGYPTNSGSTENIAPPMTTTPEKSRDLVPVGNASRVPPSLVAGFETEGGLDKPAFEDRANRRRTTHFDDEMMISQPPVSAPVSAPAPYEAPVYPLRTSPHPAEERPGSMGGRGASASPDTRIVARKSVSPRPSSGNDRGSSAVPYSPDSYDNLNPHASRSVVSRGPSPPYESPSQTRDIVRAESEPTRDAAPIIGDDGREIDPSDHLPTDTWAPEPERKNRKPEVIIRFKHSARPTSRGNDTPSRSAGPPRVGFRTTPDTGSYSADRPSKRYTPTHEHPGAESVDRTPPRADRGHESYGGYTHSRGYSTPTSADRPRSSHRGSVSPSPSSHSPLYDYSTGPPIPSKVPISAAPSYPVTSSNPNSGNPGMDALSRELKTIDIGSVGCSPGRGAVRRYAPRSPATMGYAN
ncbi:hypothetical protein NUU61_000883 [Penicillium alfredii]|uniref:C2 domain-containing protein n=1 Tax=Penicillium alfredii TaxID=1506179 RepID=A0A9W9KQ54_9EURO|nr:uncharacterized protein NUU61_000883 [Penicillium alfredii]KAJ5115124.1 hypothetical protein NUU61_000883 [Penicillium alfredii]